MSSLALTLMLALGAEETVLRAAVHIHTDFSDGQHSIDEIAERSARAGIDVVILNDHFMDEISYGVPMLREALALKVAHPSLAPERMEAYLQAAREAEQKTGVLILPGVELTPFYHWEGNPLRGDLTLTSAHRHLMVVFPDLPDVRTISATLPTVSSPGGRGWDLGSLLLLWPIFPGLWAVSRLVSPRTQVTRTRFFIVKKRRRSWVHWLVGIASIVALVRSWPFSVPRWSPYAGDAGMGPYQQAIDAAASTSSLTFWAHPETSTNFRHGRYPVDDRSEAYPDFLLRTNGADGFASLYEGRRQAAAPGGFWDQALEAFVRRERTKPLWTIGELDLHAEGEAGGKFIGEVETVVRAHERSKRAVLEALRTGAMYAVRQEKSGRLVLDHFVVSCGSQRAQSGERVLSDGLCRVEASLHEEGEAFDGINLVLVRGGQVTDERQVQLGKHGVTLSWTDADIRWGTYYRLIGKKGNNPVLYTNPIFVFRKGGSAPSLSNGLATFPSLSNLPEKRSTPSTNPRL